MVAHFINSEFTFADRLSFFLNVIPNLSDFLLTVLLKLACKNLYIGFKQLVIIRFVHFFMLFTNAAIFFLYKYDLKI